ncbi:MAG: uroporphyrinogen decarboxylase [Gemmatimonadetes bacterium]|nr:uroporphyrinogen decarboxylase [Gemmatimonadota bacterium]
MTANTTTETPTFLAACRSEPTSHTPVWIMRQAGRYLPEYRAIRKTVDFLTLTKTPELAAEVTLQPTRRFALDAAILFSDIMTPVEGMGVSLDFSPGPVVTNPIRDAARIEELRVPNPEESVPFVLETVRAVVGALPKDVPLIGFAGAPFTLFCYLVEGRGSKTFSTAKSFLFAEPEASHQLLEKLADTMALYLGAQAAAGARALMIFDSWAGLLGPEQYRRFALPAVARVIEALKPLDVPLIYFPNQGATLLEDVATVDVDVVGVDWRLPLSKVRSLLGSRISVQGNLDPAALFAPPDELKSQIDSVLAEAGGQPGHVFNLGHGIERTTNPDAVALLVDYVHERTER